MTRFWVAAVILVAACAPGQLFRRGPSPNANVEAEYAKALWHLDPAHAGGSLDTAIIFLDAYLAYAGYVQHRPEAAALRRLAGEASELARVEAALREARATGQTGRTGTEPAERTEEAVREIQRLRDELAKANAELERIRKRLATPKP